MQRFLNNTLWLIGTSRNAILVVVTGFIGYSFFTSGGAPFKLIGKIPKGLPAAKVPPFGFEENKNGTIVTHTFEDMVSELGSGIIVVPLIGILENIAICKAFGNFFKLWCIYLRFQKVFLLLLLDKFL